MFYFKIGDNNSLIGLIQSKLKMLGYYFGMLNGIFDENTKIAVSKFQNRCNINVSGIADETTFNKLKPYINGYITYSVKKNDTFFSIGKKFLSDAKLMMFANQNIDINNLKIGSKLIIPIGTIVITDVKYSYNILKLNIEALVKLYPFLETGSIGRSVLGNEIEYIRIGKGKKELCYSAAIHANEWITAPMLMKFVEEFSKAYATNETIYGYNAKEIFDEVSIYIIPMINPDGVDLVIGDIKDSKVIRKTKKIAIKHDEIPYPEGWKANILGIDLNLQFPAGWENAKKIKYSKGITEPAPRDFVGYGPLTQKESQALYNFTITHNFKLIITYHTQGQVIYWKYINYEPQNAKKIGELFAKASGYTLECTPILSGFAGYKDWFIQNYNKPGYTIEVGLGKNPLPISDFDIIYEANKEIFIIATRVI